MLKELHNSISYMFDGDTAKNVIKVSTEINLNNLKIFDKNSNSENISHKSDKNSNSANIGHKNDDNSNPVNISHENDNFNPVTIIISHENDENSNSANISHKNATNISHKNDENSNSENISHNSVNSSRKNCSYCDNPFIEELWCKRCDPFRIIEGWTCGNGDIDKFIKNTIYDVRNASHSYNTTFLEWVPFNRFKDVERIGEGGFAAVYSATWIDGKTKYEKNHDGSWARIEPQPIKVALKRLNGSQDMSVEYLNEVCFVSNFTYF
jgi:hypothetical protein